MKNTEIYLVKSNLEKKKDYVVCKGNYGSTWLPFISEAAFSKKGKTKSLIKQSF